jgi:hypothetical protein
MAEIALVGKFRSSVCAGAEWVIQPRNLWRTFEMGKFVPEIPSDIVGRYEGRGPLVYSFRWFQKCWDIPGSAPAEFRNSVKIIPLNNQGFETLWHGPVYGEKWAGQQLQRAALTL